MMLGDEGDIIVALFFLMLMAIEWLSDNDARS